MMDSFNTVLSPSQFGKVRDRLTRFDKYEEEGDQATTFLPIEIVEQVDKTTHVVSFDTADRRGLQHGSALLEGDHVLTFSVNGNGSVEMASGHADELMRWLGSSLVFDLKPRSTGMEVVLDGVDPAVLAGGPSSTGYSAVIEMLELAGSRRGDCEAFLHCRKHLERTGRIATLTRPADSSESTVIQLEWMQGGGELWVLNVPLPNADGRLGAASISAVELFAATSQNLLFLGWPG